MADQDDAEAMVYFKPVAGGWVFRAPNPRIIGRAPHYLVNDEQKARIAALMAVRRPTMIGLAIGAAIIAWVILVVFVSLALGLEPDPKRAGWPETLVFILLCVAPVLAFLPVAAALQAYRLRVVLADTRPTDMSIPASEIYQAMKDRTPRATSLRVGMLWALIALMQLGALWMNGAALSLDMGTCTTIFTLVLSSVLALTHFLLAARKKAGM